MMIQNNEVEIDFNVLPAYKDFMEDNSEIAILYGGRGSGKSWAASFKIIFRMLTEQNHRFLGIHKYERKIKSTLYQQLIDVIKYYKLDDEFIYKVSPLEIIHKSSGNNIIFFGLDSGKIRSVTGITSAIIEETTFIEYEDWRDLYLSLRGEFTNYLQFILVFNPLDVRHWLNKKFFIDKEYKASIYKSTFLDNTFLDKNYEQRIDSGKNSDEAKWRMEKFGEWCAVSDSIIFRNWKIYEEVPEDDENYLSKDINQYEKKTGGLDWGSTHNSCALIVAHQADKIIILDEIYGTRWTNTEFIEKVQNREYGSDFTWFADSAEPARIKDFKQHGFNIVPVKKMKNSVKYAIDYLKRYEIVIMPKCKNTIREIQMYSYEYDKITETIYDVPATKQEDDAMASLRYSINAFIRKTNKSIEAVGAL